ncbi:N-acetylmuramoyl-L-alanine amidase [Bacteroides sp. 214]|uniref:N-acetylmuramoyl-L-alanine amidase n=1 Tax=Bacteroides sp. 214 TaxID=2302935 RepID=UPI0013D69CEB|nr:N-acetylmuramoyl-L-alanine amidase [Bacteroides sp. 214]NDW11773.1 N-acetylmuramoyl-L-alanine amidase [Bacteroides sp. 214]
MRKIDLIVIHCSATREGNSYTAHDLERDHRLRGFSGIGYHYYIRINGEIINTRPIEKMGAHAKGYNQHSIGICYEGGLDTYGKPKDTRTAPQKHSLQVVISELLARFAQCRVCGHRDLSPDLNGNGEIEEKEWVKVCPCFEVQRSR